MADERASSVGSTRMFRYTCMPVPAGMSLPMITFSLRPRSESDLAWIAASVSTRVVSWKEAADSQDSVASDALVMPISTGRPEAGVPPSFTTPRLISSHLGHQVLLHRSGAEDAQHLVRVDRAGDELLAHRHALAVLHEQPGPHRDLVGELFATIVGDDDDLPGLLRLLDLAPALDLADRGHALGDTGLEQLLDSRQAVRDVRAGDTAGVERTHGQLGTGLTDGLRGHDAHGLAHVHPLARGERATVALGADADLRLADQDVERPDRLDARLDEAVDQRLCGVIANLGEDRAVHLDVLGDAAPGAGVLDVVQLAQGAVGAPLGNLHREPPVRAAVLLADDDVLRHVHQAPGQVPGVRGAQRGVGQALAGAVRRDEVLDHGQPLAERGLDRPRNRLALGVGHQPSHAGDLPDLHRVTTSAGVDHHPHWVGGRERGLPVLRDLGGRARPDRDELLTALVVGDQAAVVLALHLVGAALVVLQDGRLVRRSDDVLDSDRHARAG